MADKAAIGKVRNRTIFTGDNLPILRGLNSDSVDLVYLDPPFNSGKNWSAPIGSLDAVSHFKDTWSTKDIGPLDYEELRLADADLYDVVLSAKAGGGVSMMSYLLYMAPRILEMRRVLKPTGSLYYHCDPNASHYVKMMLDVIFGRDWFAAEITWKRNASHSDGKLWGSVADIILTYSTNPINKDAVRVPLDDDAIAGRFRHEDERGRYEPGAVHAEGLSGGGYQYEFHGFEGLWRFPLRRMEEFEEKGLLHFPKKHGGRPLLKKYLNDHKGIVPGNIWTDIPKALGVERVGYTTQKPTALLERIVAASSDKDGVVLDPFCGCATACIAAEKLGRRWVGIDLSPLAYQLTNRRLDNQLGLPGLSTIHWDTREEPLPRRDDEADLPPYNCPENVAALFTEQGGVCNGCDNYYYLKDFTVDHIVSRKRGGTHHLGNLQLLCAQCNSRKGTGSMSKLQEKILREKGLF